LLETTRPYEGYALFQTAYLRGQAYLDEQRERTPPPNSKDTRP
jgi:hypothetical protein